jgi:RNA polymerase sigma factor (sigma-70 family)
MPLPASREPQPGPDAAANVTAAEFETLYLECWPRLLGFVRELDADNAEDIATETFVRAWQRRSQLRVLQSFRSDLVFPWLARAACRLARAHNAASLRPLDNVEASYVSGFVQRIADRLAIEDALSTLTPEQRAVIRLRFHADKSIKATAEALAVPRDAVKQRQTRGIRALRRALLPPEMQKTTTPRSEQNRNSAHANGAVVQLGDRLTVLMRARGLGAGDIAGTLNVDPRVVERWARNERRVRVHDLEPLADALNCTVDELLGVQVVGHLGFRREVSA